MHRTTDYDVLIAGAGPAGAHTALRLARRGWRVALIDARHFPRAKPCGEFLSPACLPMLEELDLLAPLYASAPAEVSGMRLSAGRRSTRGEYLPFGPFATSHGHGLGIRREVLDTQAVEAAQRADGVDVLLGWSVTGPLRAPDGRALGLALRDPDGRRVELRSRLVVGADGRGSRVARGMGWSGERHGSDRFAIVARFEGVAERRRAEVHFVGHDYFAACPIDDGDFTANLVVDAEALKGGRSVEAVFQERLARAPGLAQRLSGAERVDETLVCGPLRTEVRRCAGDGAALVGDACGFVDPLTGEGLWFAMRGATLLAEALDAALAEPAREAAALRGYAWARRREFAPRYALAKLLQVGLRRPEVPERVIGLLERVPALCDVLLGLTGDYLPPRGLVSPAVWRSAWRRQRALAG